MRQFKPGDIVRYVGVTFESIFNEIGEVVVDTRNFLNTTTIPIKIDDTVYYVYPTSVVEVQLPKPKTTDTICTVSKYNSKTFTFHCNECKHDINSLPKYVAVSFMYCPKCGKRIKGVIDG